MSKCQPPWVAPLFNLDRDMSTRVLTNPSNKMPVHSLLMSRIGCFTNRKKKNLTAIALYVLNCFWDINIKFRETNTAHSRYIAATFLRITQKWDPLARLWWRAVGWVFLVHSMKEVSAHFLSFCVHMCTFLLQNGALWDMGLVHFGICATGLLYMVDTKMAPQNTSYSRETTKITYIVN